MPYHSSFEHYFLPNTFLNCLSLAGEDAFQDLFSSIVIVIIIIFEGTFTIVEYFYLGNLIHSLKHYKHKGLILSVILAILKELVIQ